MIQISYYALLRQERGLSEERIDWKEQTAAELFAELRMKHGFRLTQEQVRVAINAKAASWNSPLKPGDVVLLIPPVAGG